MSAPEIFRYIKKDKEGRNPADALESKYRTQDMIASKQIIFDMVKHHYLVFDSIEHMRAYINAQGERGQTFHETIFGFMRQKLKFDIDADYDKIMAFSIPKDEDTEIPNLPRVSLEELDDDIIDLLDSITPETEPPKAIDLDTFEDKSNYVLKTVVSAIKTAFLIAYEMELSQRNIVICQSVPRPPPNSVEPKKKCSYHIIVDGYYVNNNEQSREFTRRVANFLPIGVREFLDCGVNNSKQNFRMTGSRKPDSWRIKEIITEHTFENAMITYTIGCEELADILVVAKEDAKFINMHEDDVRNVLNICRENGIMREHAFRSRHNGVFIFDRRRSSHCEFCNKTHDADNTVRVWTVTENGVVRVFKSCWKDETRKSVNIGEFPSSIAPVETLPQNEIEQQKLITHKITTWGEGQVVKAIRDLERGVQLFQKRTMFDDLKQFQKHTYTDPQLRPFELTRTLCVQAHMKMGKTKALLDHINKHFSSELRPPVIRIVSFRQTFSGNLKEKFPDFTLYSDVKERLLTQRKLIIQVESLHRLGILDNADPVDLLVLDECESIFEQFDSGLLRNFSGSFAAFQWLLRYSKHVICMDAYLSNRTFNTLRRMRPGFEKDDSGVIYHCNRHRNAKDDQYHFTVDKDMWYGVLYSALDNDEKIAVPMSSLTEAKSLVRIIQKRYPDKSVKLYSSETAMSEKKEHFANVNLHWAQYDVLVYTPTVSAGVSFEEKHFHKVFGYFTDQSCPVETCVQMIGRIRDVGTHQFFICMSATGNNLPTDTDAIIASLYTKRENLMRNYDDSLLSYEHEQNGVIKYHQSDYFYLWAENARVKNLSKNSFIKRLIHVISLSGAQIRHLDVNVFTEQTGMPPVIDGELNAQLVEIRAMHDSAKIEIKAEGNRRIADAKELTDLELEEALTLESSQADMTAEQIYALRKYRLRRHYNYYQDPDGLDVDRGVIDEKFVAKYNDPKIKRIYRNLSRIYSCKTAEEALKQIQNEERANYIYIMDMDERSQYADINRKYVFDQHRMTLGLLKACGWDNLTEPKFIMLATLADNLRAAEKQIMDTLSQICTEFQIKRPSVQAIVANRNNDETYVATLLNTINKVLYTMYGVKIGTKRDEKDMFVLVPNNMFTTDHNDPKKRPLLSVKKP